MPLYRIVVPSMEMIVDAPDADDASDQARDTLLEIAMSWESYEVEPF